MASSSLSQTEKKDNDLFLSICPPTPPPSTLTIFESFSNAHTHTHMHDPPKTLPPEKAPCDSSGTSRPLGQTPLADKLISSILLILTALFLQDKLQMSPLVWNMSSPPVAADLGEVLLTKVSRAWLARRKRERLGAYAAQKNNSANLWSKSHALEFSARRQRSGEGRGNKSTTGRQQRLLRPRRSVYALHRQVKGKPDSFWGPETLF